jgi:hypothetical protein
MASSDPTSAMQKKDASYGALISIVIILAIVIVGAFYSWGKRIEQNSTPIVLPDATTTVAQ